MSARPTLRLYTSMQQFEELHRRHDRTRSTSKTVIVDRQALINMRMDHSRMLSALRASGRIEVAAEE